MIKQTSFETPFESYRATKVIGEGGAGRVYEVANTAGETYALKCLAPERVNSERLKRFKNEVAFCQIQDHPNIVKVLDTGATSDHGVKCPFYVMRLYAGTLRTQMGQLKPDEALRVFAQILDGVEAAHLTGVWHRDLKPENILWNDPENIPVVADFGIAHFEVEEIYTAVETKLVARMANFLYSAPEQRTRGAQVDHRADIFSLGLMLNELFTTAVPQGAGFKHVKDVNPPYAYIDEIVEPMIQQNPQNRPPTIEAIKKELIARKNAFVALQQYDAASRQVLSASTPPEFVPISLVGFDYNNGSLTLRLSRNAPPGWSQEFRQPRGARGAIIGLGPETFEIRGDTMTIAVREDEQLVQRLINHARNYVTAANRGYVERQREHAARQEREERAALEKQAAQAEFRKNILSKVKL
ncbi:MAG: serine/threonine protein kinase [Nitrospirae bacterium]|nr:serine/threonine protein kinase [Nitrospirota bacterium]